MSYSCHLSVAGIRILLESDHPLVKNEEFLPFLTEECAPDIRAVIRNADILPPLPEKPLYTDRFCAVSKTEDGYLRKFFFENGEDPGCCLVSIYDPDGRNVLIEYSQARRPGPLSLQNCFYCLGFESILLHRDKLCLHSSCVDTPLGGILFSGVSGIGKSTQAELWCKYRGARQINGDRPILSKEDRGWMAWGSPYAGSSKYHVNDSCSISAIILLKQGSACSLRRLTPAEGFRGVWPGLTIRSWDPSFVDAASLLAIDLVGKLPVFAFSCTPDEGAVDYLDQALRKELGL